jgi:hypothetical protein
VWAGRGVEVVGARYHGRLGRVAVPLLRDLGERVARGNGVRHGVGLEAVLQGVESGEVVGLGGEGKQEFPPCGGDIPRLEAGQAVAVAPFGFVLEPCGEVGDAAFRLLGLGAQRGDDFPGIPRQEQVAGPLQLDRAVREAGGERDERGGAGGRRRGPVGRWGSRLGLLSRLGRLNGGGGRRRAGAGGQEKRCGGNDEDGDASHRSALRSLTARFFSNLARSKSP